MPISNSPLITLLSTIFGTVFLGFGFNYTLRPHEAFAVFEFPYPTNPVDQKVIDSFCVLYGAKDLFMGVSIYSAAYLGTRKSLGVILLMASVCAGIDGIVVKAHVGHGEWNHWGYGSAIGVTGLLALGLLG
ncbi:hypothetical protein K491DRAFT_687772 [Lophiostoma macrostomum CBS 122681]|uniref:Uncharacterized protein n=1 Tax=Lophiostoma macrostomum CBS 122681 TaxID=1314788 RepID=A0A6A6TNB6_9PLEO|nr:hypothetical protein K491DRAFT_687772 [Lophiostoma macrostomum CBS 122681]